MRPRAWALALVFLLVISLSSGEGLALIRVGGGVGLVGEERAPMGRIVLDVLPLWFLALSLDVEYWHLPDRGELLPFVSVSTTVIWQATVGAAPVLAISEGGLSMDAGLEWAFKAGLGASLGPVGLFAEALFLTGSALARGPALDPSQGELRFAVGVTLGF